MTELAVIPQEVATTFNFEAVLESFVGYLNVKKRKQTTIASYCGAIRKFWQFRQESGTAGDGVQAIAAWRDSMTENRLSSATIRLYVQAIKVFSAWAAKAGFMAASSAESVKEIGTAKIERTFKRDCLSEGQARQILESIDRSTLSGLRDYAMLLTAVTCGLRACEIARAKIGDLKTFNGVCCLAVQGKGHDSADAMVKPGVKTELAIRQYLAARGESNQDMPLFASCGNRNSAGKPLNTKSISRLVKTYLDKVKEPGQNISCHSLRHTAGFSALRNGRPIEEVQKMLRHKAITTTMIYLDHLGFAERKAEQCVEDSILQ